MDLRRRRRPDSPSTADFLVMLERPKGDHNVTGSHPPKPRDMGVQVPEGHLLADHVHLLISIRPK
jgi:hypothetical protein